MCIAPAHASRSVLAALVAQLVIGAGLLPAASGQTTHLVPADQPTIQAALDAAADGDTILVAPGTYPEALDTLGKTVTLRGTEGAEATIVDATGRARSVITIAGGSPHIEGLTLTGGAPDGRGGGVNVMSGTPTLTACIIRDNATDAQSGGGVYAGVSPTMVTLLDCTLTGNTALGSVGGGAAGRVVLVDCLVSDNQAGSGGGLSNVIGATGCVIRDNLATSYGGGVRGNLSSISHCLIQGNIANLYGGGMYDRRTVDSSGLPPIADVQLIQNAAQKGGGLFYEALGDIVTSTTPLLSRVVCANNFAFTIGEGDGVYILPNTFFNFVHVNRCTVSNDTLKFDALGVAATSSIFRGPGPAIAAGTTPQITYSNVQGGYPGTGNIDADPLFANAALFDFALLPGSPSINTGNPDLPPDADGSVADMGAIPYHPWTDLGFALAGTLGEPLLVGDGPLTARSDNMLSLSQALPGVVARLVVGFSAIQAPFKGGVLVPLPALVVPGLTSPAGTAGLPFIWPAGIPSGASLYFQTWVPDPVGPAGFAASNALRATTP